MGLRPFRRPLSVLAALFFAFLPADSGSAVVFRVTMDGGAENHRDGSSWERAMNKEKFCYLMKTGGEDDAEYWVASGRYGFGREAGIESSTFLLRRGVSLYGGFKGDEESRDQRDPSANQTILDAEARCEGCEFSDNSSIREGGGAGNSGDCAFVNCTFSDNRSGKGGAAIFNNGGTVAAVDCTFAGNSPPASTCRSPPWTSAACGGPRRAG